MQLLDGDLLRSLPGFNKSDKSDPIVHAKFLVPNGGVTWWVTEGEVECEDFTFFGVLDAIETKFTYFSLSDLEKLRGPGGTEVTRDPDFKPMPISKIEELKAFWEEWNEPE